MCNGSAEALALSLGSREWMLFISHSETSVCTHRHKSLMSKFLQKRPFQRFSRGQMLIFQKWHWSLLKALPERFVSSLVSRTWVEIISESKVSICTHRHKIWNFEIFVIFCFPTSLVVGSGILHIKLCAFGCTYMCLLGIQTCFGPFWVISKH